jgi:hypothetical protein
MTNISRTRLTVSANGPVRFTAHRQPLCWNFMYSGISIYRFSREWRKQTNMGKRLIQKTTFFNKKKSYIVSCGWSVESRLQDGRQLNSHPRLKYLSVQELIRAQDWTRMSCCADRNIKLGWLLRCQPSWRRDCWISFSHVEPLFKHSLLPQQTQNLT